MPPAGMCVQTLIGSRVGTLGPLLTTPVAEPTRVQSAATPVEGWNVPGRVSA